MPNQGFDREPNSGFQARIEPGVLGFQPPFASSPPRHGKNSGTPAATRTAIIGGSPCRETTPSIPARTRA
jgi:hypothetical protein